MATPARRPAQPARPAGRSGPAERARATPSAPTPSTRRPGSARTVDRAAGTARPGAARPLVRGAAATIGSAALAIVTRPAPRRAPARQPVTPVRPPLRVVEPRARRRRAGLLAAMCCAATFAVMLGLTFFQAKIAAEQMRLDQLQTDIRAEQARYSELRLSVAELQSPRSIIAAAEKDGLHPATKIVGYVAPTAEQVAEVLATGAAGPDGDVAAATDGASIGAGR